MNEQAGTFFLGIGLANGAQEEDLAALVAAVLREAGIEAGALAMVATLDRRADHPVAIALAEQLGVPLRGIPGPVLRALADRVVTPAPKAERLAGVPGVAEAAALAAAGERARLVVTRQTGPLVTAALAAAPAAE